MINLLERSQARYLLRHRLQTLLAILGIALGVAVVNAVDISNYSAQKNLRQAVLQIDSLANYRILSAEKYFDQSLYADLRRKVLSTNPDISISPIIEGTLRNKDYSKANWQLLGIDPLAGGTLRELAKNTKNIDITQFVATHHAVLISEQLAQRRHKVTGDTLELQLSDQTLVLTIAGVVSSKNPQLLIADISTVQKLLLKKGSLSYLNVSSNDKVFNPEMLNNSLPPSLRLIKTEQIIDGQLSLIKALQFNLSALSLLAVVVGAFLIFSTLRFSILQRAPIFSRLRIQGVSHFELQLLLFKEALLLTILGIISGWILGFLLSQILTPISNRTISDLYSTAMPAAISVHWYLYLKTALLALIISLATSQFCYRSLQQQNLSQGLSRIEQEISSKKNINRQLIASFLLALTGAILFGQTQTLIASYITTLAFISSAILLLSPIINGLHPLFQNLSTQLFATVGLIALRDCQRESSRVLLAVIALCIAVSATNGIAIMVDSFRGSVSQWIENQLGADIYLHPSQAQADIASIPPSIIPLLKSMDGIENVYASQITRTFVDNKWLPLNVIDAQSITDYQSIDILNDNVNQTLEHFIEGGILISEPLARKKDLRTNNQLMLLTPDGEQAFNIAGIFRDYGAEHGRIVMNTQQYQAIWNDNRIGSIALIVKKTHQKQKVLETLEDTLLKKYPLQLVDSDVIKEIVLVIFDRTFAITQVLQLLVLIISVIAIISTLMIYQLQRREQLLTLRALGLTLFELRQLFFIQAGFIGGMAGLLAIPLGLLMAWLLVNVINPAAFGWSLTFHVDPMIFIMGFCVALLAGLFSAFYPCFHFGKAVNITELSRE
jgi:putative ABC transport system permease protein